MTGLILKVILFLLVVRLLWTFVRGILEGIGLREPPRKSQPSVKLVRDPVCGVFVVPTHALTAGSGSNTAYFCSEKCRKEWAGR
jgi:YHS domain-containing protein